jgi:hypothetical protein
MARLSLLRCPGRPLLYNPPMPNASMVGSPLLLPSKMWKSVSPDRPLHRNGPHPALACGADGLPGWELSQAEKEKYDANVEGPFCLTETPPHAGNSSPLSSHCSLLPRLVSQQKPLGFPNDLIGGRPLPHLAAFLSSLW